MTDMKVYTITYGLGKWKRCGGCNWKVRKVWRFGKEPIDVSRDPDYANGLCCYCMKELIEDNAWDVGSNAAMKALAECKEEIEQEKAAGRRQVKAQRKAIALKKGR